MDQLDRDILTRDQRFNVSSDARLAITVRRKDDSVQNMQAQVLDISRGGAKLLLDSPLTCSDPCSLRLESPRLAAALVIDASVCWTAPHSPTQWLMGISFIPPLPEEVLLNLVTGEPQKQRGESRKPICISANGSWEMSRDEFQGQITDLCEGGFCIITSHEGAPGARVILRFEYEGKSVHVTARSQWQVRANSRYVAGCQFLTPNGYSILRKVASLEAAPARKSLLKRLFARN